MENYSEQLESPKWQKKRLEVMQRDNWQCQLCSDTTTQLHVHHKKYTYNKKAWEYDNDLLITYCKHCHLLVEENKNISPIIKVLKTEIVSDKISLISINEDLRISYITYDIKEKNIKLILNIKKNTMNNIIGFYKKHSKVHGSKKVS